jgi:hypothetical protein
MKLLFIVIFVFCARILCAQSPIPITFDVDDVGQCPSNWVSRNQKIMARIYSVQAEGERKFLRADAQGLSLQISCERKWDLGSYPVLRWRWRALTFPTGSNEQIKSGDDSVLGVYVVLRGLPFVRAIKYIWSDVLPVGTAFDSPYSSGTKMIVLRSGRALADTWVTEERNVLFDYERSFGKGDNPPVAKGIAILTDSDNTQSRAVGDYADFSMAPSK